MSQTPDLGAQVSPLLSRLRAETHAAHDRVEKLPELSCLLAPDLSARAYVQALRGLYAFHARVLASLPPLPEGFLTPLVATGDTQGPEAHTLHALANDMLWFGAQPPGRMPGIPGVHDCASALGALYVAEGSALGARVIGRAVAQSIGVSPGAGGSFFCGATADVARLRWRAFCTVLARAEPSFDACATERAIAGALATFASLAHALERHAHGGPPAVPRPVRRRHEQPATA
jgi:heme oxygenase